MTADLHEAIGMRGEGVIVVWTVLCFYWNGMNEEHDVAYDGGDGMNDYDADIQKMNYDGICGIERIYVAVLTSNGKVNENAMYVYDYEWMVNEIETVLICCVRRGYPVHLDPAFVYA
eukprot:575805_1